MKDVNTRLLSANSILTVDFNTSLTVYLTNDPTYENSALVLSLSIFAILGRSLVLTTGLVQRTFDVAHSCEGYTCFLGRSAVWSTALESGEHA